jgi:hypothetical protein
MSKIRAFGRLLVAAALVTVCAAGLAPAADASSAIPVSGLLTPVDPAAYPPPATPPCVAPPDSPAPAYAVTGDLTGCWYILTGDPVVDSAGDTHVMVGTEQFHGCLGTRCGDFFTIYKFTYKITDGVESHGRCHHPITGGTGGFEGARGEIDMKDLPNGCSTYRGTIKFD